MADIQKLAENMDPEEALNEIAAVTRKILSHVSEKAVYDFVIKLIGDSSDSEVGNLVHL